MRTFTLRLIVLFAFASGLKSSAAPAPPTGTTPGCWPPPCIPVDGGISILIAAGALYGVKRLRTAGKTAE